MKGIQMNKNEKYTIQKVKSKISQKQIDRLILIIKMGTTNSKTPKQHKIQHQRFETSKQVSEDEIQIQVRTTLDDYNSWKSNLKKINFSNKENILFPLNHSFMEEGWCSQNTGFVKITYDNYPFVFEEQLENRISLDKHLSEEQMWYLLYTLVSTAKDFSFINRKVGDIRPHNIFVNEAGQIKLAVCFSWPNEPSNFQKTMNEKEITYISPQELEIIKNNKMESIINSIVAESFSIGLTMLHAGLLFSFASIYNLEKGEINRKLLEEKVQAWMELEFIDENNVKTSYSPSLKEIIRNLCIYDSQTREKSTQIFALLQPHKQSILNIEPFQLKYKITSTVKDNHFNSHQSHHPQGNFISNLQRSLGYGNYNNFQENSRQIPTINTINTPISVNPNFDWSTRTFTQVPLNNNNTNNTTNKNLAPNYHMEFYEKYANSSASSPPKIGQVNVKLTNTVSQRQSAQNPSKQVYYQQYTNKPGVITVKPFMTMNEEIPQPNVFKPISIGPLEGQIEKKVESRDFIHLGPSNHLNEREVHHYVNRVQVETVNKFRIEPIVGTHDPSDFLRKIDEQIQKSKSMFPS